MNPHLIFLIFLIVSIFVFMILQFLAISWGHDMRKQPVVVAFCGLQGLFSIHGCAGQILVSCPHGTSYRLSLPFLLKFDLNTRLAILIGLVIIFH